MLQWQLEEAASELGAADTSAFGVVNEVSECTPPTSPVKAGNVARDTIANFATTADLPTFLRDAKNKGLGVGFLDAIFGQQQGGRLAAVSGQEVLDKRKLYDTETAKDNVGTAMRERAESYDGLRDRFYGALKGAADQLFEAGLKQPAQEGFKVGGDALEGVANSPERVKAWAAEMGVATTAIGGSAAAVTLTRVAGALTGLGMPTEGAIGGLLRLAGTIGTFSTLGTVAASLAGLQLGNAAGEVAQEFGGIVRGKYFTPQTTEDMDALRAERDEARAEITRRRAAAFDPNAHDEDLKRLEGELAAAKARAAQPGEQNPELKHREADLEALKARKPVEDPEIPRLQAQLAALQRRMGNGTDGKGAGPNSAAPAEVSPKEAMLRTVIERREHLDPNDAGLPQLRAQLDRMQADHQRQGVDLNGDQSAIQHDIERRQAADLTAARAEIERKTEELSDFRARAEMSPAGLRSDVDAAQAKVDARRAENPQLRPDTFDPNVQALQDKVNQLDARLREGAALQRVLHLNPFLTAEEPELHQGPASPVAAPVPTTNPFIAQALAPPASGTPVMRLDADLAGLLKASGGLNGADIGAQIRGALTGMGPTKVDVGPVSGTVTGLAEVATTIAVKVETGPELKGAIATAHYLASLHLEGKLGTEMDGSNGAQRVRPGSAGMNI